MEWFCEQCYDLVDYKVIDKTIEREIKGKTYSFEGKQALCDKCDSPMWVGEVVDYNIEQLKKVYYEQI